MEEQGVVRPGILDQPVHSSENVRFCGLAHRTLLIICKKNHVPSLVSKMLVQISRHVLDVIDTAAQLATLVEVVDSNQQSFPTAGTVGVLEGVAAGCPVAKLLRLLRRGWRVVAALHVLLALLRCHYLTKFQHVVAPPNWQCLCAILTWSLSVWWLLGWRKAVLGLWRRCLLGRASVSVTRMAR